ncbi:origin recognition complex subunit 4 [Gnomoniopsis smithogilvyi]|uniref:Origin recognition complex subunit 4 n=1 Tax=Gnomoniopsis smithogilvyi TaxID=1191159 RepID=A0A9W8YRV8_9PEZI|nr:origin recognition complex subunit 4 [Gnomoniopsis smithogilvyi]
MLKARRVWVQRLAFFVPYDWSQFVFSFSRQVTVILYLASEVHENVASTLLNAQSSSSGLICLKEQPRRHMAPNATPGSRKRGRPRNDPSNTDSPVKKPRLTSSTDTKKETPGSLRSLSSAKPKSLGSGRRKISTSGSPRTDKDAIDKIYEIADSDEEGHDTRVNPLHTASHRPAKRTNGDINGVYEFHGSDEEPSPAQTPSRRRITAAATSLSLSTKRDSTNVASKDHSQVSGRGTRQTAPRTSRRKVSGQDEQAEASDDGDGTEGLSDSEDVLNTPSAVRTSNKIGASLSKTNGTTPKLKGILTPSRRLSERNPKSVAFNDTKKNADEIFFADLPNKVVKSTSVPQTRPCDKENLPIRNLDESETLEEEDEEDQEEEEEDVVCVVCSKPESKPPNQILFCDGCDMAVHQKCYGVARIPKDEWLCNDCSQTTAVFTKVTASKTKASIKASEAVPEIPNLDQHLRSLQRVLLDRCTGRRRIKLCGQDEAYEKTFQLVEQTVMAGEGNSMLIIGARGTGKTTMVDSVLSDIGLEHRNEFHVVRLNGFIHTDDKLALKDIWRQLGKEMEVEENLIGKTNNYADTLASLLALLSHPSEISAAQDGVTSRSVVFIIDEFDLFATHARQTLLYNLFDIAQARKAPIAVLGLTNKIDVVESLEKRVKSRFSHRYAYMSLPKTFREYWDVCRQGLLVDDQDAKAEGLDISLKGFTQFHEYWTNKIELLYKDQSFKDLIEYHYYSSKSVPAFLNSCILPLANLSPFDMTLRLSLAQGTAFGTDAPDSKLHLLESLSDLDLSLLISAARLDIVAHTDTVNFAMAYDEYTALIGRQRVQSSTSGMMALGGGVRVWGRGVAEMAWERLVSLGLLLPTGMGGRHGGIESRMWKVDVTLEEIPVAVKLNTILARWCKEI